MNAVAATFELSDSGRASQLGSRSVIWILIAAAHVALVYIFANLSHVAPAFDAMPILAEILPEPPQEREAPPPPAPTFVPMQLPSMEPPVVQIAVEEAPRAITMVASDTPKPVPPAPRVVSEVAYLRAPAPQYPSESRRLGEEGMVLLRVMIDEAGRADRIEIERSSGHSRLDNAARAAVKSALFRPYIENGVARAVLATIPIEFTWKSRRAEGRARGG
jgi:protein TonB